MQTRVDIVRELAGDHFASGGAFKPVKVNLLALHQSVVVPALMAGDVRYNLATFDPAIEGVLEAEEAALNARVCDLELTRTLQEVVRAAMLPGGGWVKVALTTPEEAASEGYQTSAGQVGVWPIDFEDLIVDCAARRPSEFAFVGHWYLCPVEVAKARFKRRAKDLQAASDTSRDFNDQGIEKLSRVFRGYYGIKEFEDHVRLAEVYIPRHKVVVTLCEQDLMNPKGKPEPLWVQPWIGPDCGPFLCLGYKWVPGSPIPSGPLSDLFELHNDYNAIIRKLSRQALRYKEVTVGNRMDEGSLATLRTAPDGQVLTMQNPDKVRTIPIGGAALPALNAIADVFKQLFMLVGGNLELLGGRNPQSKTAHQDQLLNENAGAGLAHLQDVTTRFVSDVGWNLWWFEHHHPENVQSAPWKTKSGSYGVLRPVYPPNAQVLRKHNVDPHSPGNARIRSYGAEKARVRVDPYSLGHKTPQQRLTFLRGVVQDLIPVMPLLQQAGLQWNVEKYVEALAHLGDEPDVLPMFNASPPPEEGGSGVPHDRTLAPNTSREYVRRNVAQETGVQTQQSAAKMLADSGGAPESFT